MTSVAAVLTLSDVSCVASGSVSGLRRRVGGTRDVGRSGLDWLRCLPLVLVVISEVVEHSLVGLEDCFSDGDVVMSKLPMADEKGVLS
jgi:hypothetical protein